MAGCNQKILIFWCFSQGQFQTMSNAKAVQISCLDTVIVKHPLVSVSPACNWGRGQFLKASCHSWGFDKAALKGNL
jgi:hypothetical protein